MAITTATAAAGGPISGFEPSLTWSGRGKIGPAPAPVIIFLAAAALAHVALRSTRYGRKVYAVGGASLFGGSGTIFGTVIGSILIGVLLNGLVLMNVSSYIQQIVIGIIIVLAVAFDTFAKSRRRRI